MNEGQRRRDEGMDRAKAQTPEQLVHVMWHIWRHLCQTHAELTTDDFWLSLTPELHDQVKQHANSVGKMVSESAKNGWVRSTGRSIQTRRVEGNARKITVWKSLICGQKSVVAPSMMRREDEGSLFD